MLAVASLIASLKEAVGKAFLFSGLLPATAFLVAWEAMHRRGFAERFFTEDAFAFDKAANALVAVFGLGLFLFASRSLLLFVLQALPGPLLAPLRSALIRLKLRARGAAWSELERAEALRTAESWLAAGAADMPFVAPQLTPLRNLKKIKALREKLGESPAELRPGGVTTVEDALCDLLIIGKKDPERQLYEEELGHWRKWYEKLDQAVPGGLEGSTKRRRKRAWTNFHRFPDPAHIPATWLGIKAVKLNDYTDERYGISLSTLWPRLSLLLKEGESKGLADARLAVETLVNLSFSAVALALVLVADNLWVARWSAKPQELDVQFASVVVMLLGASVLFYMGSVFAFGGLADRWCSIADLHCRRFVTHFFPAPKSLLEQHIVLDQLERFYVQGDAKIKTKKLKSAEDESTPDDIGVSRRRLGLLTARAAMRPVDGEIFLAGTPADGLPAEELRASMEREGKQALLFVDLDRNPRAMVTTQMLAQGLLLARWVPSKLADPSIGDLFTMNRTLSDVALRLGTPVSADDSLLAVCEKVNAASDHQYAIVTEDGTADSAVIGVLSIQDLAAAARL